MNEANTRTMIAAAAVIVRPVACEAAGDREAVVAGAVPFLVDAADEEHLVVHREAEQDREHHHRDERLDRAGLVDTEQANRASPTGRRR